jgi:hypothetical protein
LDQWLLLSDGDDRVDVQRIADGPDGGPGYSMRFEAETITAGPNCEQWGVAQILEWRDCAPLLTGSEVVSLSFYAKATGLIADLKTAILVWSSTKDAVTSDLVQAWGGAGIENTWAANWTREGAVGDHTVTGSWARYTMENILIDTASAVNLAVVIWLDSNDYLVGDQLFLTGLKLENGAVATPYILPDPATELLRCERYFTSTFNPGIDPGDNLGANGALWADTDSAMWRFPVPMFSNSPTITKFNPGATTAGYWNSDAAPGESAKGARSVVITGGGANDTIHATAEAVL